MDEIEQQLQLDIAPASWPIGMGADFQGCYDHARRPLVLIAARRARRRHPDEARRSGAGCGLACGRGCAALREDVEMARGAVQPLRSRSPIAKAICRRSFSAARSIISACANCWTALADLAPPPRPQPTDAARRRSGRDRSDRLRLQGPGQYGPEPSRPRGVLRAVPRAVSGAA